jgi:hypothetical protein
VFDAEEDDFLKAVQVFKQDSGKPFPTYTDLLGIIKALGYVRLDCGPPEYDTGDDFGVAALLASLSERDLS